MRRLSGSARPQGLGQLTLLCSLFQQRPVHPALLARWLRSFLPLIAESAVSAGAVGWLHVRVWLSRRADRAERCSRPRPALGGEEREDGEGQDLLWQRTF